MARLVEGAAVLRGQVYAALLADEEDRFARRGGRLALVRDAEGVHPGVVSDPGPVLAALRRGDPVEVPSWKVMRSARDRVQDAPGRVVVHRDGRVVACGA